MSIVEEVPHCICLYTKTIYVHDAILKKCGYLYTAVTTSLPKKSDQPLLRSKEAEDACIHFLNCCYKFDKINFCQLIKSKPLQERINEIISKLYFLDFLQFEQTISAKIYIYLMSSFGEREEFAKNIKPYRINTDRDVLEKFEDMFNMVHKAIELFPLKMSTVKEIYEEIFRLFNIMTFTIKINDNGEVFSNSSFEKIFEIFGIQNFKITWPEVYVNPYKGKRVIFKQRTCLKINDEIMWQQTYEDWFAYVDLETFILNHYCKEL